MSHHDDALNDNTDHLAAEHQQQVNDRLRRRVAELETQNARLLTDVHERERRIDVLLQRHDEQERALDGWRHFLQDVQEVAGSGNGEMKKQLEALCDATT